jgi:hypothetical protein
MPFRAQVSLFTRIAGDRKSAMNQIESVGTWKSESVVSQRLSRQVPPPVQGREFGKNLNFEAESYRLP